MCRFAKSAPAVHSIAGLLQYYVKSLSRSATPHQFVAVEVPVDCIDVTQDVSQQYVEIQKTYLLSRGIKEAHR